MILKEYDKSILGEKLYYGTHETGLKVYVLPKCEYNKSYAVFSTHYGSVDNKFVIPGETKETEVPDGIAHFLEHKLFEEQEGNAFDKFSKLGASANAFTSFNMTAYLFSCTDNFYDNFKILLNFVQNPYFTEENVNKEQGIIEQEIRMYDDDPNWRVFFNFLGALYSNHPVRKDIAGTVESIKNINKDVLYKCYNTFYHPSNMSIFVTGNVDVQKVGQYISSNIKTVQPLKGDIKRIYPNEPLKVNEKFVKQNFSVSIPLFQMGFKDTDVGYDGNRLLKKEIIVKMILQMIMGKSTELYKMLYENGYINDTFEFDYSGQKDYGFTIFGGESSNPEKVRQEIINEIERLHKEGLSKEVLRRIKKVIYGRFVRQFNDIERIANAFIANTFRNVNLFDYIDIYKSITFEDIQYVFDNHFNVDNFAMSVVQPH